MEVGQGAGGRPRAAAKCQPRRGEIEDDNLGSPALADPPEASRRRGASDVPQEGKTGAESGGLPASLL